MDHVKLLRGEKMVTIYSNKIGIVVEEGQYDLHVLVEDESSGTPIVGAMVSIKQINASQTTNSQGYVDFTLPSGSYTVEVSATNYNSNSQSVNLQGNTSITIYLTVSSPSGCTYYITTAIGEGEGYVSPASGTVSGSQTATFTATPYGNYMFASWSLIGNKGSSVVMRNPITLNSTSLSNIASCSSTVTLKANFVPRNITMW